MTSKVPKYFLELLYTSKTTVIFLPGVSRTTQNLTAVLKDVLVTVGVLHTVLSRPRTFDLCSRDEGLKTSKRKPAQCQNSCQVLIKKNLLFIILYSNVPFQFQPSLWISFDLVKRFKVLHLKKSCCYCFICYQIEMYVCITGKPKKDFMHGIPQQKCYQLQVSVCSLVVSELYLQVLINLL